MATLTVKNVGPIREVEIEVKKHTVFIGPQGTGKSTLAKLIAIGGEYSLISSARSSSENDILEKYSISSYLTDESDVSFTTKSYTMGRVNGELKILFHTFPRDIDNYVSQDFSDLERAIRNLLTHGKESISARKENRKLTSFIAQLNDLREENLDNAFKWVIEYSSIYVPSERNLVSLLSSSIWSIFYADVSLPESLVSFARNYEQSRNKFQKLSMPFLKIQYHYSQGSDSVINQYGITTDLTQSASGYQSIIPLLLVVEHQRQSKRRFIIEEPELNLYPTAQKDLIYSLVGGLNSDVKYEDAEWVITTHSPYVLTSYNTLMLAYKVAQKSEELRAEVDKIIPERYWINPDDFAAYYVDNGTVESIVSPQTGMISDSRLDDVSEDFAGEQDQLLNLYRSVPSA